MKTNPFAFVGNSGAFYVRTGGINKDSVASTYTKRESVAHYNDRVGWPEIVPASEALADFEKEVTIDPVELKVVVE